MDRLLTDAIAGPARAIAIEFTREPAGASRTSAADAVDVGFIAVFSMVGALIQIALERYAVAGFARAIGIDVTPQPVGASRTSAAAAVDVGFIAVFSVVGALIQIALERYAVAGVARAIGIGAAMLPEKCCKFVSPQM